MKSISLIILGIIFTLSSVAQDKNIKPKTKASTTTTATSGFSSVKIGYELPNEEIHFYDVITKETKLLAEITETRPTLFVFSCNTCPYVIKAQQRTQELINLAKELNISLFIVNSNEAQRDDVDSEDAMQDYANNHNYEHYYIDKNSVFANLLGATKTPEVFLFDKDNKLVYKGAMDDNPANPEEAGERYLFDAMHALVNNQPIKIKESKSVGCTIKRIK